MKQTLFYFFLLHFFANNVSAERVNAVKFFMNSDTQITYLLDEKPIVVFKNNEIIVRTHLTEVCYESSDILKYTYVYIEPDGIKEIKHSQVLVSFNDDLFHAKNLPPASYLSIYSVNGMLIKNAKVNESGEVTVHLPNSSQREYLIKTSVANFKLRKL